MKNLISIVTVTFLWGCQAISLNEDASSVFLSNEAPLPECVFISDIVGHQGDFLTGQYTSNKNLERGALNDLKNQAAALGGNRVHIISQRAAITGDVSGDIGSLSQTNVTYVGNVYSCPREVMALDDKQ